MRDTFLFLKNLKGNAKVAVLAQPLWGVPFNLFTPFATIYMFYMGVTDIQIGLMLAISRLVQVGLAFFGGVVTDKFGRRLTNFVGDLIGWSLPALIWALARDFRWFLVAAIVNGVVQITSVAWECLWIDDDGDNGAKITQIYNWIHICGVLAAFFVPIAGFLVGRFELIPVVRGLYAFAVVSMTAKATLLYAFSRETKRGMERMAETKGIPLIRLLSGYREVFGTIFRSAKMLRALALQALQNTTLMIASTFFALYTTQNLGLDDSFLAYFPILRAVVMLVFLFLIQGRLLKFNPHRVMLCGIAAYITANAVLLLAPTDNWIWIAFYVFVEACGVALLIPRLGALVANAIEPKERARIRGLFNAAILALVSPLAFIAGWLSDMNRRLPFVLNIGLFVLMLAFTWADAARKKTNELKI
ncbi:MAG: MFS transporter [Defluviitaleaceae bacterium]|nr:MFS transporter [Defluviitaleaceae bacterium]